MKQLLIAVVMLGMVAGLVVAAPPSGGAISDTDTWEMMEETGLNRTAFRNLVRKMVMKRLYSLEEGGILSAKEIALRSDLLSLNDEQAVTHIIENLKFGAAWTSKGMYMTGADITAIITARWTYILRRYREAI